VRQPEGGAHTTGEELVPLRRQYRSDEMAIELDPAQPAEIAQTIEALLVDARSEPDPWWRAGLVDALADDA